MKELRSLKAIVVFTPLLMMACAPAPTQSVSDFGKAVTTVTGNFVSASTSAPSEALHQEIVTKALTGTPIDLEPPIATIFQDDVLNTFAKAKKEIGDLSECKLASSEAVVPSGSASAQTQLQALNPGGLTLARAITDYGKALSAVASASPDNLQQGIGELFAGAISLASSLSSPADSALNDKLGAAIVAPLKWIAGQYLEQRKIAALREATSLADPIFPCAMYLMAEQANALRVIAVNKRAIDLDYAEEIYGTLLEPAKFSITTPAQSMDRADQLQRRLESAMKVEAIWVEATNLANLKVAQSYLGLALAHSKLTKQLANPNVNWADVSRTVNEAQTALSPLLALLTITN